MPNNLLPWAVVHQKTQRWLQAGSFEAPVHDLRAVLRMAAGHPSEPTAVTIDSRTLRSAPEVEPIQGYDGAKRKRGLKLPMTVDTLDHQLTLHVTAAYHDDRVKVKRLARAIQMATDQNVELADVDQGDRPATALRDQGIGLAVVKRSTAKRGSCCCRGAGWSSDPSATRPSAVASSKTISAMLQPLQISTSSYLHTV